MPDILTRRRTFAHAREAAAQLLVADAQQNGRATLYPDEAAALAELLVHPDANAALKLAQLVLANGDA